MKKSIRRMTKRRRKTTRRRRMPSRSIKSMWKNTKHRKKKLAAALAALALLDIYGFKYRELQEYKKQAEKEKNNKLETPVPNGKKILLTGTVEELLNRLSAMNGKLQKLK